jgi:hypothetical protein
MLSFLMMIQQYSDSSIAEITVSTDNSKDASQNFTGEEGRSRAGYG